MWLQLLTKKFVITYLTLWLCLTPIVVTADSYDFVIGGGTAGCVLANRLSAYEAFSVLLLEEGEREPDALSIPANASKYAFGSGERYTFEFESVPQKNEGLASNGILKIRTAKVLGGGTSINSMRFNRGSPEAFDTSWARVSGDQSWTYSNLLKYFKRVESYEGQFSIDQHGQEGSITISSQSYAPGISNWLEAGKELGYRVYDPNGRQQIAFTPIEYTMKRGRRISAYTGYIHPIEAKRKNLKIITEACVKRVLFEGRRAIGVIYTNKDGANITVSASKEIIISAGVFGSSKLLLLSGVGPAENLEQAKIPLIKDLPVGENLQAAPLLTVQFIINNSAMVLDPSRDYNPDNWKLYEETGEGPYSTVLGYAGQAFLASPGEGTWADVEVVYRPANVPMEPWKNVELEKGEVIVLLWIALTRNKSGRGRLSLNPDNPSGKPLSDWNFFEDSRDVDTYLWGILKMTPINEVFKIMNSKAFEELGPRYLQDPLPACGSEEFMSKSYWKCYIRQLTTVTISPSGTCSLGHVVDSELKVKGLQRLRVVDASVIPLQANINLMAEVYAVAEKASEMIMAESMNCDEGSAFQCPRESGYFPHRCNCLMFFHCSHWVAHKIVCPYGLYFNEDANPGPVCDWPQNVACRTPATTSTERTI